MRLRYLLLCLALVPVAGCGAQGTTVSSDSSDSSETPDAGGGDSSLGTAEGTATTPDGEPAAGCAVSPESVGDDPVAIPEPGVFTDEEGSYEWTLLDPAGTYVMVVDCDAAADGDVTGKGESQEFEVGAGETVTADVVVE